jgi:transcriptional regulator with XRE-family HTH domain
MSLGERIIQLRKEQDMSQGQLADLIGVSRQAVSKWENDTASPDTMKLIRLADVLGTEIEYLATGKKPVYLPAPVVVNVSEKVDRIVERVVEKPVIKRVIRIKYRNDPIMLAVTGVIGLVFGLLIGLMF